MCEVSKDVVAQAQDQSLISPFSNVDAFAAAQRMARCLSASNLVPDAFRGEAGIPNALIALELAQRLKTSVFMVMQNLYVIHGRPAFSSQYIIAAIQSCGRYSTLRYKKTYDDDGKIFGCRACATELATGAEIEGPEINLDIAQKEGWLGKTGSKWKTMPEQMLMYRAASAFGRLYAPDVMMGFKTQDELIDIGEDKPKAKTLNAIIEEVNEQKEESPATDAVEVEESEEVKNED